MAIHHHEGDLPANVTFTGSVAIDTETMGLNPFRDALCVVQLSDGKGDAHVVRLKRPDYDCPNLKALVSHAIPNLTVLSYHEILPSVRIEPVGLAALV